MATKRIKDLAQTATLDDLASGSYLVIDTAGKTKRLPANLLLDLVRGLAFCVRESQTSNTANDYDTFTEQGVYNLFSSSGSTNYPETGRSTLLVMKTGTYTTQTSYGDNIKYRVKQAGSSVWSSWKTISMS